MYLKQCLETVGLHPNPEDQSTYPILCWEDFAFLWIQIDDGILTASLTQLLSSLQDKPLLVLDLKWDDHLTRIY